MMPTRFTGSITRPGTASGSPFVRGKSSGAITAASGSTFGTGTVELYKFGTRELSGVTVSVKNDFTEIADEKCVYLLFHDDGNLYCVAAEC